MPLNIKRVDYVSIPVDDLNRAKGFYGQSLGLRQVAEIRERWVEYDAGNTTIALYPKEPDEEPRGGEVGFVVDNVEDACSILREKGVSFPYGIERFSTPRDKGRLARFTDPFQNKLEIIELSEPQPK